MPLCQGKLDMPNTISFPFLYNITSFLGSKITYSYHKNKWEKRRHTFLSSYVKTYLVCISLHYHWQQRCHVFLIQSKEVFSLFPPARHQFHFIHLQAPVTGRCLFKTKLKIRQKIWFLCFAGFLNGHIVHEFYLTIWNNYNNSHLPTLYYPFSQDTFIVLISFFPCMC